MFEDNRDRLKQKSDVQNGSTKSHNIEHNCKIIPVDRLAGIAKTWIAKICECIRDHLAHQHFSTLQFSEHRHSRQMGLVLGS